MHILWNTIVMTLPAWTTVSHTKRHQVRLYSEKGSIPPQAWFFKSYPVFETCTCKDSFLLFRARLWTTNHTRYWVSPRIRTMSGNQYTDVKNLPMLWNIFPVEILNEMDSRQNGGNWQDGGARIFRQETLKDGAVSISQDVSSNLKPKTEFMCLNVIVDILSRMCRVWLQASVNYLAD